jgi:hypothetical protein
MRSLAIALALVILTACGSGDEPTAPETPDGETAGDTDATDGSGTGDVDRTPVAPPRVVDPVDELQAMVKSSDEEERQVAADKLGDVPAQHRERAVVVLESMLGDESAEVRQVVAGAIARTGLPRLDGLRSQLRVEENEEVRRALVTAIFEVGGKDAVPELLMVANDVMSDENFRAFAIDALGRLRAVRAREILEESSEDISPVVRRAAVIALGQIASDASLGVLGERVGDNDASVRLEAIRALKSMNKRKSVSYLIDSIETNDAMVLDELIDALQSITGKKHGYDKTKSLEENADAVKAWLAWWEKNKSFY